MRFCVVNLGCKVNRVESDSFEGVLMGEGCSRSREEDADVIVVNTCTVTGEAEKKTRKAVRHALRANAHARVVVTGCAAAIDPDLFAQLDARVSVVAKADVERCLADLTAKSREEGGVPSSEGSAAARVLHEGGEAGLAMVDEGRDAALFSSRTRVGLKVQDGCDNACTYCIVHVARGRSTSVPASAIVERACDLARSGVREVVLSGINIGSYDFEGLRLAGLLERLLEATSDLHAPDERPLRFRVSSIEPADIDDDFVELLARSEGRVCRHLHVPLQSGSSKVLREMARPYDAQDFAELVEYMRACVPSLALTTDVIVGFPGETDDDFAQTCDLARRCGFSKIHVFPYSRREGTPAAERRDQVDPSVRAERARVLRSLSDELRRADRLAREGTREWALVEERGRAMTESYYEVDAPAQARVGSLACVTL